MSHNVSIKFRSDALISEFYRHAEIGARNLGAPVSAWDFDENRANRPYHLSRVVEVWSAMKADPKRAWVSACGDWKVIAIGDILCDPHYCAFEIKRNGRR